MDTPLIQLFRECVVKVKALNRGHGSGFFVTPDTIMTCAHVVGDLKRKIPFEGLIRIRWKEREAFAQAVIIQWLPDENIALLRLDDFEDAHVPCVHFGSPPETGNELSSFGYPDKDFPNGRSVTVTCDGYTGDTPPLFTFKLGNIRPGMSGAPILNLKTNTVCGMIKLTLDRGSIMGGGGVSVSTILDQFSEIKEKQITFHRSDTRWMDAIHPHQSVVNKSHKKKVFISYSQKDESFAVSLYENLTRDGVSCFFDKESIQWGENWVLALEKGIDRCDHIVLVLSPSFCDSEWAQLERTSAIADDPGNIKRKIMPLLYESCEKPRFLKPIQHIDVTCDLTFKKNYPKICEGLGGIYIPPQEEEDIATLPPTKRLPEKYHMPYSSLGNGFVGRVSDLWQINDILRNRKTAIVEGVGLIEGTGGLGKTQLAIEYVHRFGYRYPGGVFWVEADQGIMTVIQTISENADIEIDPTLPEKAQIAFLWKRLNHSGNDVLIILDNFPEQGELSPYLPVGKTLFALVTTRRRDLTNYSKVPLKFLSKKEGLDLLNLGNRTFDKEAEKLIEKLAGLPLAIELARNYLNLNKAMTIEKLLAHLDRTKSMDTLSKFTRKYSNQLPSGHDKEIAATIQFIFGKRQYHVINADMVS